VAKVHKNAHTIDRNRVRCDVYLNYTVDKLLIDYLAPFIDAKHGSDELKRLVYLGLHTDRLGNAGSMVTLSPVINAVPSPTPAANSQPPSTGFYVKDDPLIASFGMPDD